MLYNTSTTNGSNGVYALLLRYYYLIVVGGPRIGAMYTRSMGLQLSHRLQQTFKQTDIFPILYVLLHDVYDLANLYIAACSSHVSYRGTIVDTANPRYRCTKCDRNATRLHSNAFYCERYASSQWGVE